MRKLRAALRRLHEYDYFAEALTDTSGGLWHIAVTWLAKRRANAGRMA